MTLSEQQQHAKCLRQLVELQEYRDAIDVALGEEIAALTEALRKAARAGETLRAAQIEAKISAFEEVLRLLERYAAKYRVQTES